MWNQLKFWNSPEWETILLRLSLLDAAGVSYNPAKENLFASLQAVPLSRVRVVIVGQDPYPNKAHATGIAFHTGTAEIPPSLRMIYRELAKDMHYDYFPTHGSLMQWCVQGILLWNATPTCETGKPASHRNWEEWDLLTREIIETVSNKGECVFIFLGGHAREFAQYVDDLRNRVIEASHPSPRASNTARCPFMGSRIFSRCNDYLNELGQPLIEWRV